MDRIPAAFEKRVGHMFASIPPVEQIRKTPTGVRVVYRDKSTGTAESVEANYCICTLPFTILRNIDADLSPDVKTGGRWRNLRCRIQNCLGISPFLEKEYSIYGGISFLAQPVNLVWYPSAQLFSERGILLAGYGIENGSALATMNFARSWMLRAARSRLYILATPKSSQNRSTSVGKVKEARCASVQCPPEIFKT